MGYLLMPLAVYLPVGIYLYCFFRRFLTLFGMGKKSNTARVLSLGFALVCAAAGWRIYGFGAVLVLHFFVLGLLTELAHVLLRRRLSSEIAKRRWSFLYRSGTIQILAIFIIMGYGLFNMSQVKKMEYQLETGKRLSSELKIAQISDLHMGTAMTLEKLKEYCGDIGSEEPDLLALTGDIFDEGTKRKEMEEAARVLGGVHTRYGVYYVFGNHDYNYYTQSPYYTEVELRQTLEACGIHVLEDEAVQVSEELTVAGRRDYSVGREALPALLGEADKDTFLLLLDHQPRNLEESAGAGVDLQLSGHTHAGQIWPTGQLSELMGAVELNYGWRKIGDFQIIVSSGIAGWGYPIRTGGHSEYGIYRIRCINEE